MDDYHEGQFHFPVTIERLSAYLSLFDVASSGVKYVQFLGKASGIIGCDWPSERVVKELLRGAAKFSVPRHKSFITGEHTGVIISSCIRRDKCG